MKDCPLTMKKYVIYGRYLVKFFFLVEFFKFYEKEPERENIELRTKDSMIG
jgi:hypothetical protein